MKVSEDCNTVLTGILNSGLSLYTWLLQTHLAPCGISGEGRTQVIGEGGVLDVSKSHHIGGCQLLMCSSGASSRILRWSV